MRVWADSAYGSGEFRAELIERGHVDLVKPAPVRPAIPGCPAGITRTITPAGRAVFKATCRNCSLRDRCATSAAGRTLAIRPHDTLQREAPPEWSKPKVAQRISPIPPLVERAIAWLVRGNRKVRYRGVAKNDHWLHHRAAALNLRRLTTLGLTHTGTAWALA